MAEQMVLEELLANYTSTYGGFESWRQLLGAVQENRFEAYALDGLVAELRANGAFRTPILLGVDEDWGDYDADLTEPIFSRPAVIDGTKRVLAHMLVGSQVVAVDISAEHVLGGNLDRYIPSTKVQIQLPLINVQDARLTIKAEDKDQEAELDLWDGLMSLRVSDDVWLSVLTSGSQRQGGQLQYSLAWDVDALPVPFPLINNALLAQMRAFGYDTSGTQAHTVVEDWGDDAPVEVEQAALHELLSGYGDSTRAG